MTKQEHVQLIESIRTAPSDVDRNQLLLKLTEDYTQVLTTVDTITAEKKSLTDENAKYAKLNNDLFLQLNVQGTGQEPTDTNNSGDNQNEPPTKLSFEDLTFED
jgi:hypothetical protein